jgi:glucosamine kinase
LRAIDQSADREIDHSKKAQTVAEVLPLFRKLSAVWNSCSLDEFVRRANSNPDFAALLPAIVTAADAEDALAQRVLVQAGRELAQLASIVVSRLFAQDAAVPLAMAGGVFRHSPRVRQAFGDDVRNLDLHVEVIPHIVEPVAGALQMARQARRSD